jgi:putative membrane protein
MAETHTPGLLYRFGLRWLVSSLGLWIAAALLGPDRLAYDDRIGAVVVGGFILAIINAIIRPIVVILSLPAILFTLGLFMIVINGLMVMLASAIYGPLEVSSLWSAMLAGIVIGLVNYLVTAILEER